MEINRGSTRVVSLVLLVIALAVAAVPAPALAGKPTRGNKTPPTDFVKVGTHPQAASQPTAMGKTIATLKAWNGRLYTGYGDYNANTGPIAITHLSGSTFDSPELFSDTEAVWRYREINGRLYAPSIDPRASSDFAVGTTLEGSSNWLNPTSVHATHAYDIATLTGEDLWIVGSQGADAVAWRSLDGGSTWSEALRIPPMNSTTGDFARFFGVGVYGGKLYVQAYDNSAGPHPNSAVFDGTGWSDGPSIAWVFSHAETFAGRMVFHATVHSANWAGSLMAFDGTRSTVAYSSVYDYTIEAGTLYALTTDGKVMATRDLATWTQVGTAPSVARSIGVLNGVVYVGGTDSAIYRK